MRNAVIVFTLLLITVIGFGCSGRKTDAPEGFLARSDAAAPRNSPDFVTLAKKLQPIVVNISTTQTKPEPRPRAQSDPEEDNPMDEFMERFFGQRPQAGSSQPRSLG
jgi:S1-C subfamily serine protease